MERLLTRMLERGWISEFAVLHGGGLHIRWTADGALDAGLFRLAAYACASDGDACFGESFWRWMDGERGEPIRMELHDLRPFLLGRLLDLGEGIDRDSRNTLLEICERYGPKTENGI